MRVADILRQKGTDTATVQQEEPVARAVDILRDEGFGALVVSRDGKAIDGIVSERDIVRALGLRPDLLERPVSEIMTAKVFTCTPDHKVDELMAMMTEHRFRHVPVEIDGALGGLVSIGDVVKHRVNQLESETQAMQDFIQGR